MGIGYEELETRREKAKTIIGGLKKRNIEGFYCQTKEEALKLVTELVPDGASAGWGGSVTLKQLGLFDALREKGCRLFDMDVANGDPELSA